MSDQEKELQIGRLVSAHLAAKGNLQHCNARLSEMQRGLSALVAAMNRPSDVTVSPTDAGKVLIREGGRVRGDLGTFLVSEAEFAAILAERDAASAQYKQISAELDRLGIRLEGMPRE